jgi:cell division protein FtsI/penicillin-binding protein 2
VTQGQYQPGLVVEPFIIAAAIADDLIEMDGTVDNLIKPVSINESEYGCEDQPTEGTSWKEVLKFRCPYPLTVLASRLGESGLFDAYNSFSFFEAPELPLATETGDRESITSLTMAGIGQDQQTISPLQVGRALASLANDGGSVKFEIVSAIRNERGSWQPWGKTSSETKLTVPAEVAEMILKAMPVNNGISEHSVVVISGPSENTTSWYLGLGPASEPRYGTVVVVENSRGEDSAVPIGRELLTTILGGRQTR